MPLVPIPRIALISFGAMVVAAILLRLFSYEFSVPTEGLSGIATTAFPKVDVVVLSRVPTDAAWSSVGDEWGGSLTHLRSWLIGSGLVMGSTFLFLHLLVRRAPSVAPWILLLTASGSLTFSALGGLLRAWANYETRSFYFSLTCCTLRGVEIIEHGAPTPHLSWAVSAGGVDLLSQVQEAFGCALAIFCIASIWALYSRFKLKSAGGRIPSHASGR
jgi:hypothetical protein